MDPRTVTGPIATASLGSTPGEAVIKPALILVAIVSIVTAVGSGAVWGATVAGGGFLVIWLGWALAAAFLQWTGLARTEALRRATLPLLGLSLVPLAAPDFLLRSLAPRRTVMVLVAAALLFIVYLVLATGGGARLLDAIECRAVPLLVAAIVLHGGFAVTFVAMKYGHSIDHMTGHDTAYQAQLFWNTIHGRPLEGTLLQQLNFDPPVRSNFAFHNELFHLLLLPAYALWPNPALLVALRSVALALTAIPIFWLLARHTDRLFALLGALVYLLYPTTVAQSIGGFYTVQLAIPLLVLTLVYYRSTRFRAFVGLLLLTISTREDVALALAMLGGLAWLEKRSRKWVLTPLAICLSWWAISYFIVMPAFGSGGGVGYRAISSLVGTSNPAQSLAAVIQHALTVDLLNYIYQILKPTAFTALADPTSVLLLPIAAINALIAIPFHGTPLKILSYQSALAPAIVTVSLLGAASLATRLRWIGLPLRTLRLALLGLGFPLLILAAKDAVAGPIASLSSDLATAPPQTLTSLIPERASVAAPINLLPVLANRAELYWVERIADYSVAVRPEFVVIADDRKDFDRLDILQRPGARERYERFVASLDDGYRRVLSDGGYAVYAQR